MFQVSGALSEFWSPALGRGAQAASLQFSAACRKHCARHAYKRSAPSTKPRVEGARSRRTIYLLDVDCGRRVPWRP